LSLFAVISSHGSENPTQAALPLVIANGAHEAGHTAEVILMGDAVVIAKQVVRDAVFPVGWPPLKEMYATALKNGVKVHV
jgi:predicted peroxiredoxin